jgi:glutamate--cysteine ligase
MFAKHTGLPLLFKHVDQRLARLINSNQQNLLKGGKIGLEKETLRVGPDGMIAQTRHPRALGSSLTHPWITTDFAEALLELITPPFSDPSESLQFLRDTQTFVCSQLQDERLWPTSMPCMLAGDESIHIAEYGTSNAGKMKHVYRVGLGHRYGLPMQVIAGVHFNYSLSDEFWPHFQDKEENTWLLQDFISESYIAMIRNLQRLGWVIPYLFGASPAVCKTYVANKPTDMESFDDSTYYYPYATSLRMGDIGYQNNKEYKVGFKAVYDNLNVYIASLTRAIETPCPKYEEIGVVVGGEYRQLNANILQIENEYYSTVRPKQPLLDNEKPTRALRERGVQYVELRSLDVNAFHPVGVDEQQLRFLEAFMILCLLHDSPRISGQEAKEIDQNEHAAAHRGREPKLKLQRNGRSIALSDWAGELCIAMEGICEILDTEEGDEPYTRSLNAYKRACEDPDNTPSALMLAEMRETGESFHEFARRLSQKHYDYFRKLALTDESLRFYTEAQKDSWEKQRTMEKSDSISFEEYLQGYFAQS